jgi:hypothetical protein
MWENILRTRSGETRFVWNTLGRVFTKNAKEFNWVFYTPVQDKGSNEIYILTSDGRKIWEAEWFIWIFSIEKNNGKIVIIWQDALYKPKTFETSQSWKSGLEIKGEELLSDEEIDKIILREGLQSLDSKNSIIVDGKEYFYGITKWGTHMLIWKVSWAYGWPYTFKSINMIHQGRDLEGNLFVGVETNRWLERYYPGLNRVWE